MASAVLPSPIKRDACVMFSDCAPARPCMPKADGAARIATTSTDGATDRRKAEVNLMAAIVAQARAE